MTVKCFLSCVNVRNGTRIVAVSDFWISLILMIKLLSLLNPFDGYEYEYYLYNHYERQITYDFNIFTYLFIIFVFLYVNYYLKESTYDYKTYKIYQWLAINSILLSFHVIAVTYITIKYNFIYINVLYYSTPICVVHVVQIYIVKCFYNSQMSANNCSPATIVCNNNINNESTTVTVLSTQCSPDGLTTDYTMGVRDDRQSYSATATGGPTTTINYPRLHHLATTGCTPPDQVNPSCHPQEYLNPPPYSPSYEMRRGSSHHCNI